MVIIYPKSSTLTPSRDQWPTSENRSCDVLLGLLPSLGEDWQWCYVCCEHQVWRQWSHKSYFLFISCIPCPLHPRYLFRLHHRCHLPPSYLQRTTSFPVSSLTQSFRTRNNHCTSYSHLSLTSPLYPNPSLISSIKWSCSLPPVYYRRTHWKQCSLQTSHPPSLVENSDNCCCSCWKRLRVG